MILPHPSLQQKRLNRVKSAGQWAQVIGWLVLLILPLVLASKVAEYGGVGYLIYFVLTESAAVALLTTGRYIQQFGGKHISAFLLLCAIISFFFAAGIIPLIGFICIIIGNVSFSRIQRSNYPVPAPTRRATLPIAHIVIMVILVVVGLALVAYGYSVFNSKNAPSGDSSPDNTTNSISKFESSADGFTIQFPGSPKVSKQTIQQSGYSIPYTTYESDLTDGSRAYYVAVTDFTGTQVDKSGAMQGEINGAISNTQGAKLVSSNSGIFEGYSSQSAQYTFPSEGNTYSGDMTVFFVNTKLYAILMIGGDRDTFNSYVNTFSLM